MYKFNYNFTFIIPHSSEIKFGIQCSLLNKYSILTSAGAGL